LRPSNSVDVGRADGGACGGSEHFAELLRRRGPGMVAGVRSQSARRTCYFEQATFQVYGCAVEGYRPVAGRFTQLRKVGDDDRGAAGASLEHGHAESFVDRWKNECRGSSIDGWHCFIWNVASHPDTVGLRLSNEFR